jgi:hypothetical protein
MISADVAGVASGMNRHLWSAQQSNIGMYA